MSEKLLAAKIVNTHGIRGEVKAVYYTDSPQFFEDIKKTAVIIFDFIHSYIFAYCNIVLYLSVIALQIFESDFSFKFLLLQIRLLR